MSMLANHNAISTGGYTIQRSLRFRASASAYLNRTPASAGNRTTWTWSGWVKRGTLNSSGSVAYPLFAVPTGTTDSTWFEFRFLSDFLYVGGYSTNWRVTTQVFRDPSAWYHIVLAVDTTQATANNRIRLYVNGSEVTTFTTLNNPTQNASLGINQASATYIGFSNSQYFDGYLTEINFIDGQALTPSSFGETDTLTGVWTAKKYTGTYGTNGFYLPFTDTSSTTNLVKDSSGNNNNWTPNNISLTAGVTYDSMIDSPTITVAGTQPVGNYAVLNPLCNSLVTLSNANLTATYASTWQSVLSNFVMSSGKWYWEVTGVALGTPASQIGIDAIESVVSSYAGSRATAYVYQSNGQKMNNNTAAAYGATYTTNDIIGIAFDADSGTIEFFKNNASQGVAYTSIPTRNYTPVLSLNGATAILAANFGQRPFSYTPPTGFRALCTTNLPDSTIVKGNQYMDAKLWAGNDANPRSITGLNFNPDLVWIKSRSNAQYHVLNDSVRGGGTSKALASQLTDAEGSANMGLYGAVTAFNSDGFSVGGGTSNQAFVNFLNYTYVGWAWDAGSSTVTNTSGSISSQVRANTTAGVSIVTYTGTGANATVGHGLGVAPKMIITKGRDSVVGATNWSVYHASIGNTQRLVLNSTAAAATVATAWNNTSPTSTVFSIGTNGDLNGSTATYVAYCFAEIAGFSSFGKYTGNGSTDGPFVYCGFRPKFVMFKCSSTTGDWTILDSVRDEYNEEKLVLYPNLSNAEATGSAGVYRADFLSNGFKIRGNASAFNASGATYIYMAFAESPYKVSLAR